jgi:hypothetical protein
MLTIGPLVQYAIIALLNANYECWCDAKWKLLMSHQIVTCWRHDRAYQNLK